MITLDRVSLTAVGVGALVVFAGCAAPAEDEATGQVQAAMPIATEDQASPEAPEVDQRTLPLAAYADADAEDVAHDGEENVDSTQQGVFIGGFGGCAPGFFGCPGFYGARFGGFYPGFGIGLGYGWGYPGFGFGVGRAWGVRTGFIW
jgi:hypothetical protein